MRRSTSSVFEEAGAVVMKIAGTRVDCMNAAAQEGADYMSDIDEASQLLTASDPEPVEWVNAESDLPVLLLCEHAGQAVPESLGDLGLPNGAINRHIGWDIGAEALARCMARRLGAPLLLQRYSRLVIDCNRPPETAESIPEVSDGQNVPGNMHLTGAQRKARVHEIFEPLNAAIREGLDKHPRKAAFSIHSFTTAMQDGPPRPWHAGFLSRRDPDTVRALLDHIAGKDAGLVMALNEPYQIGDQSDWFIPVHAEPRGLRHTLIEIRNDQLRDKAGIALWADYLCDAIEAIPEIRP